MPLVALLVLTSCGSKEQCDDAKDACPAKASSAALFPSLDGYAEPSVTSSNVDGTTVFDGTYEPITEAAATIVVHVNKSKESSLQVIFDDEWTIEGTKVGITRQDASISAAFLSNGYLYQVDLLAKSTSDASATESSLRAVLPRFVERDSSQARKGGFV